MDGIEILDVIISLLVYVVIPTVIAISLFSLLIANIIVDIRVNRMNKKLLVEWEKETEVCKTLGKKPPPPPPKYIVR